MGWGPGGHLTLQLGLDDGDGDNELSGVAHKNRTKAKQ